MESLTDYVEIGKVFTYFTLLIGKRRLSAFMLLILRLEAYIEKIKRTFPV